MTAFRRKTSLIIMNKEQLDELVHLNELRLTQEESELMMRLFGEMKPQEASLLQFDTTDIEEMVHVMPLVNVLRQDSRNQLFSRAELLKGTPEHTEDSWQVPRLVK